MTGRLRIWTLGGLRIELDGEPLSGLASRKAEALLIYLAVTGGPHSRDHLATLLWGERPQTRAMGNLSVVLSSLRKQLPAHMDITHQAVGLKPDSAIKLDVTDFQAHIQAAQETHRGTKSFSARQIEALEAGVEIYTGYFLAGFHIRGARGFEEWALLEGERLQWLAIDAFETLINYSLHSGTYQKGIAWAHRCLRLDPLREEIHRHLMLLLSRNGQWSASLAQYEACKQVLANELGVEPTPETRSLYERIQSAMRGPRHNLPPQTAPFFGRQSELAHIGELMADPACRLLTIIGPGGIGKTRLALQFGAAQLDRYLNGIYFIPLAPINLPEHIVSNIAEAIDLQFQNHSGEMEQLIDYLRDKEMLLILDNFEHLLEGVDLLIRILREARRVKFLVTTRERLNVQGEWVHEIEGLPYPSAVDASLDEGEDFGAVQLFLHKARQVKSDFIAREEEQAWIVRICQMVEGMPLGIELASAWVRVLPCREIALELQGNLDFLHSQRRDIPARHRHMRAVFDHSWNMLSEAEQRVFSSLSVFRGGFDREAAKRVAGATLDILSSLTDKSLIRAIRPRRPEGTNRFDIHELLRQYARSQLNQTQEEAVQNRHSEFFAMWLHNMEAELWGDQQNSVFLNVGENIENIRAAWQYASQNHRSNYLGLCLTSMYEFYLLRGWFKEGEKALSQAISDLSTSTSTARDEPSRLETEMTLGRLFVRQGIFCAQLGRLDHAEELLNTGLSILRELDTMSEVAFALNNLGIVNRMRGRYRQAREYLREGLTIYQQLDNQKGIADVWNTLGSVADRLSEYGKAREQYGESLRIRRKLGDQKGMARSLLNLGSVHYRQGEYTQAATDLKEAISLCQGLNDKWGLAAGFNNLGNVQDKLGHYEEANKLFMDSLAIKKEIGHRKGVAATLYNIGKVAFSMQDYHKARGLFSDSVSKLRELGEKWSLANGLAGLGRAYMALGLEDESGRCYQESLAIAREIDVMTLVEQAVIGFAELMAKQGDTSRALELAAHVNLRPPRAREVKDRAEDLLRALEENLPPAEVNQARIRAQSLSFDHVVDQLINVE